MPRVLGARARAICQWHAKDTHAPTHTPTHSHTRSHPQFVDICLSCTDVSPSGHMLLRRVSFAKRSFGRNMKVHMIVVFALLSAVAGRQVPQRVDMPARVRDNSS